MDGIRTYLLSVVAAAVICGIVTRLVGKKGTQGAVIKMITGIFLTFTLIRPITDISLDSIGDWSSEYHHAALQAAAAGESRTKEALASGIKSRCEAYILDKADKLNASVIVEVTLTDDDIPVPSAVRIIGKLSPYARSQLQDILSEELGINKENQIWT